MLSSWWKFFKSFFKVVWFPAFLYQICYIWSLLAELVNSIISFSWIFEANLPGDEQFPDTRTWIFLAISFFSVACIKVLIVFSSFGLYRTFQESLICSLYFFKCLLPVTHIILFFLYIVYSLFLFVLNEMETGIYGILFNFACSLRKRGPCKINVCLMKYCIV